MSVLTALADDSQITREDFKVLGEINQIVVDRVIAHDFEEDGADEEFPEDTIDDER